jgi:hypothetical protein
MKDKIIDLRNLLIKYSESFGYDGQGDWTFKIRDEGIEAVVKELPTLNREKVQAVIERNRSQTTGNIPERNVTNLIIGICSLSLPALSEKKAIKNFTDKLANQEDIPLDIIDIVNENFWDLLPDKHPKDKPTLSEGEIEEEAAKRYGDGPEVISSQQWKSFVRGAKWAIKELTKPKER